jgi:hypothetical protein
MIGYAVWFLHLLAPKSFRIVQVNQLSGLFGQQR